MITHILRQYIPQKEEEGRGTGEEHTDNFKTFGKVIVLASGSGIMVVSF